MNDQPETGLRYDFAYTPSSTYARAARLLARCGAPGLVVDLGCGPGVFALALSELGFGYVGVDVDTDALAAASSRGIDVVELDVSDIDAAIDRIVSVVGDRPVSAVSVLDVVEHLPDPDRVLAGVGRLVDALARDGTTPMLVVSIPNVSHADLGAKLVTGRWDVTEVGLLDDTHITLFTEQRVRDVTTRAGFVEIGADDNVHDRTEQEFPVDHPAVGRVTVLSQFLRSLRGHAGPAAETYQFVRCYRRADDHERDGLVADLPPRPSGRPDDPATVHAGPFLSVIVRTQGGRASLLDTLTSLAAQTDRDIEVFVTVHHDDPAVHDEVRRLVALFEPDFVARVHVIGVVGGRRGRPLNVALQRAGGRYVALLDDDDLAVADWVEAFRGAADRAPGTIVRAPCVVQWTERVVAAGVAGAVAVSGFEAPYPVSFDYLDHVRRNRSPSCSYALPIGAIRALDVRFDEELDACEDWKFLMAVARWTGVTDATGRSGPATATSVYRRSRDGGGAEGVIDAEQWGRDHLAVAQDLASEPSLVPPGALMKVRHLYEAVEQRDEAITALRNRVDALERSRVWRLTAPARRLAGLRRSFRGRN